MAGPHTTTVRFPKDVWEQLKVASQQAGVPAAQYIREAAIARLAAGADVYASTTALQHDLSGLTARVERLERTLVIVLAALRLRRPGVAASTEQLPTAEQEVTRRIALGRAVRGIRARRDITQAELASRTGLSVKQVGALERGEVHASPDSVSAVADALGVPVRELLEVRDGLLNEVARERASRRADKM
ncbi:MAG: helix-turn-helix transcriptional regulator [Tepidisphaeraceae bacterium]